MFAFVSQLGYVAEKGMEKKQKQGPKDRLYGFRPKSKWQEFELNDAYN